MREKIKQRWIILIPVVLCLISIMFLNFFWMHAYRQAAFAHVSALCETFVEEHPEAEEQVLSAVKEYDSPAISEISGNDFLAQYGYRSSDFGSGPGWRPAVWTLFLFLLTAGSFLLVIWGIKRRERRRIAGLTGYLEQVNAGAGGTIIQESEDEFSRLEDEMYKTVTELSQTRELAVAARKNFADNLANIAHQMKTPITAASLSLQLMEKNIPEVCGAQVRQPLERLGRLEESLLTLSRIDAGTLPLNREKVDVYTALSLAAENLADLLAENHVSVDIPEKGCVEFTGDLEWTMEALMNLIKNCMEHSSAGGTVHCDYAWNPLYVEITVRDEGEGFCPEDLPHLFERFYRGRRAAGNGIGIGLSLARSIFELQNGNVTARNLPEGGACFEVRLYSH